MNRFTAFTTSLFTRVASAVALVVTAAVPLLDMGGMPGQNANEIGLDTPRPPGVARMLSVDDLPVLPTTGAANATPGHFGSGPEDWFLPVSSPSNLSAPLDPDPALITAQVPPPGNECYGCLWRDLGGMCGRQKVCKRVPGPEGVSDCVDRQLPGEFPCSRCDDNFPVCTPPPPGAWPRSRTWLHSQTAGCCAQTDSITSESRARISF